MTNREKEIMEAIFAMGLGRLNPETYSQEEVDALIYRALHLLEAKEGYRQREDPEEVVPIESVACKNIDIDRIAQEYFDDRESEFEMDEIFALAKKGLAINKRVVLPDDHDENEDEMGHWIIERDPNTGKDMFYHCSKCYDDSGFTTTSASKFCPNCGKKMHRQPIEEI